MDDWETGRLGDEVTKRLGDWETRRREDVETGCRNEKFAFVINFQLLTFNFINF